MFLYEEDKKNIRVYNYLIDEQKLYDFKKEQMAKIKEEERLLRAVTNYCYYPLEEKKKILAYSDLNYEVDKNFGHSSYYHFLSPYEMNEEELERQRKFLEKYYHFAGAHGSQYYMLYGNPSNDMNNDELLKLKHQLTISKEGLFLIPTSKYEYIGDCTIAMNNILNVPPTLYYLEDFLASDFKKIPEQYIKQYIKLFSEKEVKNIDIGTFNIMVDYNLVSRNNLDKKIKDSAKVLKLIKK